MAFATVEEAIEEMRAGRMVIVADDEDRENEGDIICAAQRVTAEHVNFMLKHARGMICVGVPIAGSRQNEALGAVAISALKGDCALEDITARTIAIARKIGDRLGIQ